MNPNFSIILKRLQANKGDGVSQFMKFLFYCTNFPYTSSRDGIVRPVGDHERLLSELNRIEGLGGEGLILRRRGSAYTAGRSNDILKVKRFSDMEAKVVAHIAGKGKHVGRMGSVLVELPDRRIQFRLGTGFSDEIREHPPSVGTMVTFKYYGLYESGIPKFPSFLRTRDQF